MVNKRLKFDCVLITLIALTAAWNIIATIVGIHGLTSYFYMGIIIIWTVSINREIPDPYVRMRMEFGGFRLFLLLAIIHAVLLQDEHRNSNPLL